MTLEDFRSGFPHAERLVYLNHAATSPLSTPVREAMEAYTRERGGIDPAGEIDAFETTLLPLLIDTREKAAELLGTGPDRVAFVQNTSAGLNVLAEGLDWQAGDRVAIPDGSFPTNVFPFLNQRQRGVAVDFIPTDEGSFSVKDVERTLRPGTRVVSISWVHFLSGFRADLREIGRLCADRDILFCVDAIQGLGALQIDVDECQIDVLAAGGHKWMMATQGIGILYCSQDVQGQIQPSAGWLHGPVDWEKLDDYELTFHDDARRFEAGTLNSVGLAALNAALEQNLEIGPKNIEDRIRDLAAHLAGGLAGLGLRRYGSSNPAHGSGIVTIAPDDPEALAAHLKEEGVVTALRNRKLRFAPHAYVAIDDLDRALEAVAQFTA
ncbi:aminotransferase [Longibacter salinarum]|uniref:Aminotransferase n=1 Tax=Longibacter salinarum TaxID=1850348 RepID=A0A2A8D1F1_9BACT|nr:aminotransferase class V-fold PLP-dependent enzyme [Longibacter salinarum]PEN14633.1 aminotransferase [Longibacter salinarum]